MAEPITIKALQDASLDAKSLEEVVNGDEAKQVTTRKGETYPSVKKAIKTLFQNGGLPATPFATAALMTASALVDGDYAQVTDSPVVDANGLYIKQNGVWVKSSYDPLGQSKQYTDSTGYASITGLRQSNINYDTATRELQFKNTVYIFSSTNHYVLATPATLLLPSNTPYRIEYVIGTGELVAMPYSYAKTLGNLIVGFVYASDTGLKTQDFNFVVNNNEMLSNGAPLVGFLHGNTDAITVDTLAKKIDFKNARVVANSGVTSIINQSLDYTSASTSPATHYLYYSKETDAISLTSSITYWQNQEDLVLVATIIPLRGEVRGLAQPYTRNGQIVGGVSGVNSGILLSAPSDIDFKFALNEIVIAANTQVLHNKFRILLPSQTIDISSYTTGLWYALTTDRKGNVSVIATNSAYSLDAIIIGAFRKDGELVANIDNYSIDGVSNKSSGSVSPVDPVSAKLPSLGWSLDGVYTAPTLIGYRSSGADPLRAIDVTSDTINGWFDSLVAAHPDYITKTHMGDEYTGLPINEYRFKPNMAGSTKPIKVLIHGGTHGEPMSYLLPYHAMKLIAENWQDDPLLEAIRFGVEFSVVPAVNAWGITNDNDRYNSRGINLNRNYPIGWSATGDNTGTAPLSELEAQYAYANMTAFKPDIAMDIHSFGTTDAGEFLWITVDSSKEGVNVGASMMNRMRQKWVKETPDIVAASALDRNAPTLATGSTMLTMKELGAIAITFEFGTKIIGEQPLAEHYSELSVRYGVEALINYLIIMLRRNA